MCQTILIDNVLIRKINSKYPILSQKLNRICSIIEYTNHGLKILDQYNYKQQNSLSFFFLTALRNNALWVGPTWRQERPTSPASPLTSDLQ